MEEDGEETPRSPFWLQSTNNVRLIERYRRRLSSLFFNSGVLIILLLLFAVISMVFIIPSVVSYTSRIFRPNFVKKSWDSINLVLVLFALAFGFLSRNINSADRVRFDNGYNRTRSDLSAAGAAISSPSTSTPHQWYDFPEQPITSAARLRRHRSSSSYPDLREISPRWNHHAGDLWKFSDDTHLNSHRVLDSDRHYLHHLRQGKQDSRTKDDVQLDTFLDLPEEDSSTPPPQPPVLAAILKNKPESVHQNISAEDVEKSNLGNEKLLSPDIESEVAGALRAIQQSEHKGGRRSERRRVDRERRRARSSEPKKILSPRIDPLAEPSSPPPALPTFPDFDFELKSRRSEKKRGGPTATKEFFTSFYHKKKKKIPRHKSVDNLEALLHHPKSPPLKYQLIPPSPTPPPPPPPPPPPSVLHNLFASKKEKRKKGLSAATAPRAAPPPPPPPAARAPRPTTTRVAPFTTEKPRVPMKMSSFYNIDDSSSGGESPLKRIPPPPPPPPFKMPDWKFTVEGDFVRLQSTLSSRSGSPEGDEAQSPSSDADAAAAASPLFCPSPDVDTKADTFIARFRAGLKLEKLNSFNQNEGLRMSNLGPGSSPNQT